MSIHYSYRENNQLEKILSIKTFYEHKWLEMNKIIKYLSFRIRS